MIDNHYIVEWSRQFPWRQDEFVEQDLLISRAIVAIYSDPYLAEDALRAISSNNHAVLFCLWH